MIGAKLVRVPVLSWVPVLPRESHSVVALTTLISLTASWDLVHLRGFAAYFSGISLHRRLLVLR